MADLVVHPSVVVGPEDIITADLLNLLATPVVDLAIAEPVNDQNFFRNGNFYSSYWSTPTGMTCPVNVETSNANYWYVKPQGAAVTTKRSTSVPDTNSLFTHEIDGAVGVTDVEFGQHISADLSATLRRICTFSGQAYNNSGLILSPKLRIYSANAFNNFSAVTLQQTVDLQTCSNGVWTFVSSTLDLSTLTNIANGIIVAVFLPSGTLSSVGKSVLFSRIKFQIGEVATEFTDDVSLFVTAPSVDSTMLQDGCIARPTLFLPHVVPVGAYVAKSIKNGDIDDGAVSSQALAGASTTLTAGFTQPAVSATVSITVTSTLRFVAGQAITIAGGGAYTVTTVTDGTHMVVTNTGGAGNAAPAANVPTGGAVTFPSAVIGSLGYTPINKAGDSGIGPGILDFINDDPVGATAHGTAALRINSTSGANASNDGYMPAISFNRIGVKARALGLAVDGRLKTVDQSGTVGYLLDSVTKVDTASYQDASITYAKLAQSAINLLMPCGAVLPFAGPSPPGGWFVCDGSWQSRTAYPALFAAIGTYWGVADGTLYFALPDFRGRHPIGYVNSAAPGITARGFGTIGGEENTQLAGGHLPAHAHNITDQQHNHSDAGHTHQYVNPAGGLGNQPGSGGYSAAGSGATGVGFAAIQPSFSNINHTENFGGNVAHNNMSPFAVLYYIIKAV